MHTTPLCRWLIKLVAATAALWAMVWAAAHWVQPVSRRACNATYILWMLAFNLQVAILLPAL
jgi:glucosaminylphosphatidylinositol acyltransferase